MRAPVDPDDVGRSPADLPRAGRLMGIDWGTKRIGVAVSDERQVLAHPVGILTRREGRRFPLAKLRLQIENHAPVALVIGLPLESDGSEGPTAARVREESARIAQKTAIPIVLWDERMTTARVHTAVRELGGRIAERPHDVDPLAAVVLLQSYLDSRPA